MKFGNGKINEKDGVEFITFDILDRIPGIKHAFSTKKGGVSSGMFSTMNLSFTRGDSPKDVYENYKRFFMAAGLTLDNMVMTDQIHKTDIYKITKENICKFPKDIAKRRVDNIDGLITNLKNVPLVTFYADCVPLYFVDKKNMAIGMSHSGWRGTVAGMGVKTVEALKREYGSNTRDIVAVIGPSICRKCYEVSKEVIDEFERNFGDKFDVSKTYDTKENGKFQFDLWLANKSILMYAGLEEENIVISNMCTACNSDLLFSNRITNGKRGNLAGILELI